MAKRELSGTLRNLKFMQRAAQREEKAKKDEEKEVLTDNSFPSSGIPKKCVVIVEGDPHPGATKGRMSFQSFNPSIDKLNEEQSNSHPREASATCSGSQNEITTNRKTVNPPDMEVDGSPVGSNGDLQTKQDIEASESLYPNKSRKYNQEQNSSSRNNRSSQKQSKREKLDWNVLRPPKHQNTKEH